MRLGLIAGNGRFPFLVLDAARGAGHDVTVIALKEETFPDLADAAARPPAAALHWISLGQLGKWHERCLKAAGVSQAVMAGQVKHTKLFADIVPGTGQLWASSMRLKRTQHRRDHLGRGRRAARERHRVDRLDGVFWRRRSPEKAS